MCRHHVISWHYLHRYSYLWYTSIFAKGQEISEWIYEAFASPKIWTKKFEKSRPDYNAMTSYIHSEISWPLWWLSWLPKKYITIAIRFGIKNIFSGHCVLFISQTLHNLQANAWPHLNRQGKFYVAQFLTSEQNDGICNYFF